MDGKPKSWKHYIVGLRRLAREQAETSLTVARATKAANINDANTYDRWIRAKEREAGLV